MPPLLALMPISGLIKNVVHRLFPLSLSLEPKFRPSEPKGPKSGLHSHDFKGSIHFRSPLDGSDSKICPSPSHELHFDHWKSQKDVPVTGEHSSRNGLFGLVW